MGGVCSGPSYEDLPPTECIQLGVGQNCVQTFSPSPQAPEIVPDNRNSFKTWKRPRKGGFKGDKKQEEYRRAKKKKERKNSKTNDQDSEKDEGINKEEPGLAAEKSGRITKTLKSSTPKTSLYRDHKHELCGAYKNFQKKKKKKLIQQRQTKSF